MENKTPVSDLSFQEIVMFQRRQSKKKLNYLVYGLPVLVFLQFLALDIADQFMYIPHRMYELFFWVSGGETILAFVAVRSLLEKVYPKTRSVFQWGRVLRLLVISSLVLLVLYGLSLPFMFMCCFEVNF